jgi:hypothetical protein
MSLKLILRLFFLVTTLLALSACDIAITKEQKIKKHVKEYLNDPDSAKFDSIHPGKEEKYSCGMVNAKNRMGGYVGFRPFVYEKVTDDFGMVTFVNDPPTDSDFRMLKGSISFKERYSKLYDECKAIRMWDVACVNGEPNLSNMCRVMLDGESGEFVKKLYKDY